MKDQFTMSSLWESVHKFFFFAKHLRQNHLKKIQNEINSRPKIKYLEHLNLPESSFGN